MPYEPTPKVKAVIDAMRAEPQKIWTSAEVAPILEVLRAQVPSYLETAVRNRVLFRKINRSGKLEFSAQPFPVDPPATSELTVPTLSTWKPPRMEAPRAGSDERLPTRAPGSPPAPSAAAPSAGAPVPPPAEPASAPAPEPSPAPSVAEPEPVAGAAGDEVEQAEEEDQVTPNAFVDIGSGDVILIGCDVDEDGRVTVPSQLVRRIVGRMAWTSLR